MIPTTRLVRSVLIAGLAWMAFFATPACLHAQDALGRPNILLIVADDMNGDTPGCFGNRTPEITPNIDRLAAEGMRFRHAHVTVAVCTPCRGVLMTGLYPHHNGTEGFQRFKDGVETLPSLLTREGYYCGTIGKCQGQQERFLWSKEYVYQGPGKSNTCGRDPEIYYRFSKELFQSAFRRKQPFFLMANSHDPHRPWYGSPKDIHLSKIKGTEMAPPSRVYRPEEIQMPSFAPQWPEVRADIAQYYSSVRRCDDTVGAVLKALKETGQEDNTLIMFLSDNGMSCPFAKTNCYLHSTRTPWIVRWPGRVQPGSVDNEHFISAIDFMPTVLAAIGIETTVPTDGKSILPLLVGEKQTGRDRVFTQFHHVHANQLYPMRCVQNERFGYIFNPWSDGKRVYDTAPLDNVIFRSMVERAKTDPAVAERLHHLQYRTVEEFYDFEKDPDALHNLIGDPAYAKPIAEMKQQLREWMVETGDMALDAFDHLDDPEALARFMRDYSAKAAREVEELHAYEAKTGHRF